MKNMTFGITLNNNPYVNVNQIDTASVREVAQEIFTRAQEKAAGIDLSQADLARFKRPDMGVNLYDNSTNLAVTKQISLNNAGMNVNPNQNLTNNIQYLNAQAAQNVFYSTERVMDGKVHIQINEESANSKRKVDDLPRAAQLFMTSNTDKDKRGANPFYAAKKAKDAKEDSENTSVNGINIFA